MPHELNHDKMRVFISAYLVILLFFLGPIAIAQIDTNAIEIIRDKHGVPHIFGGTDQETAYGLAWAHAEDDFKTIQETFLPAKGMLGRYMGKKGAVLDYLVELLRCKEAVDKHYSSLSPEVVALLKGYTEGLNSYAKSHPKEILISGSFPMTVKEYLTGLNLVIHFFTDSGNIIRDLFNNEVEPLYNKKESVQDKKIGSNAFAISRTKTKEGKTYFNVNTHQPLNGSFAWYEAHVVSDEGWNMLGGLFPGSPCPFIGTNEFLGWTHTYNYPDLIDTYQLEMHPKEKNKYRFDTNWVELEKRTIKLTSKFLGKLKINVKKEALWCKYGPVIKNKSGYFSFHSGAFDKITAVDQWYHMNKATGWQSFNKALNMMGIPRFNVMYADRKDTIFYLSNALLPIRKGDYNWDDLLPGNTASTLTHAYHNLEELPQIINPKCGYLFNTNNSPFNCTSAEENLNEFDFDSTFAYQEGPNNRSQRFMDLIAEYDQLSYDDFKRIKYDQQYPKPIIAPFDVNGVFHLNAEELPKLTDLITIFQKWDYKGITENIGAAHWRVFYSSLKDIVEKNKTDKEAPTPKAFVIEALVKTNAYFKKHFGTLKVPLGDFQKHIRGEIEMPLSGLEDVIAAINVSSHKKGRVKASSGESYIMLIKYNEDGVEIETIVPYGASNRKESKHYSDQMERYKNHQLKKMTLDEATIRNEAIKIYHPQ